MSFTRLLVLVQLLCLVHASTVLIDPDNAYIQYKGRVAANADTNGAYNFDWPGVEIIIKVTGTSTIQGLVDSNVVQASGLPLFLGNITIFNVFVNGTLQSVLNVTSETKQTYNLFEDGLLNPSETCEVRLTKRTEACLGVVGFYGFIVDHTATLVPPTEPPSRRLEFLGDSITCGYGIIGMSPCPFTPETENNYLTYGQLIARELEADVNIEAWSGIGLVRNYGEPNISSVLAFPDVFPRTLATNPSLLWDFDSYQPNAVVINLGTNDFDSQPNPPADLFEQTYLQLIKTLNTVYPNQPKIFLVCGPMISGACCDYVKSVAESSDQLTYIDLQNILEPSDIGCQGHPNISGHIKMSNISLPIIQKVMGW
ncbi:hypothetical protein SAMD00019534_076100 [Acytostelium subglobosum LB1]|uniref:hypothetical protein n=1 Tax=Acytostelium subglobosum LB1 TaxID=1410327 RepID=UPI00064498D9|nr:hypothetical protein SAMD00019534_076100 [Acytostelium subglobosum LB1]GAM24435.1 hypothetical protein SAMD00019534_076100 [Acytostelium subglobosum LB1]|eukprot:XP_012752761.1 hypothetical protein SAMD00019534_076100 [Acytostelium subglobosum LB1]